MSGYNHAGSEVLMSTVFITGATGYIGRPLAETLISRGHRVAALVQAGRESRAPRGATIVTGDALHPESYQRAVPAGAVFVQLVGVSHPSPAKAEAFASVDRVAGLGAVRAARSAGASHFVYISVAQPAPIMRAYQRVRAEVESEIRMAGLDATILRPWYVTGPGHRWPLLLAPVYRLMETLPSTREAALRLGLVTREQMLGALIIAVEKPEPGIRVWGVERIRLGNL